MSTRIALRLDFDQDRRLGPGKIVLLEVIARQGSISAAGRESGMAYRRAWLLTDELNRMFAGPLVETRGGGRNGGGASLTELGADVVRLYRPAGVKVRQGVAGEIGSIERALAVVPSAGEERVMSGPEPCNGSRRITRAAGRRRAPGSGQGA